MCLRAFSKDRFCAWFHFLYFFPICLVLLELKSFPQNPFTSISAKALMFPQQEFIYLFLRFLRGKYCFFCLHQFPLHIIDSALKCSVNHTHLSHTLASNSVSMPLLEMFFLQHRIILSHLKPYCFQSDTYLRQGNIKKCSFVCVCYLLALRLKSSRKRSTRMWTSCQCLRSSIR